MLLPSLIHIPHSLWGIFWQLGEQKMFIPFFPIFKTALSQLHSQLWPLQIIEWASPQDWFTEIPLLLLTLQNLSITAETSKGKSVRALHVLSFIITCTWIPSSSSHGYSLTRRLWAFWRKLYLLEERRVVTTKNKQSLVPTVLLHCCHALHNPANLSSSHESQLWRLMYVW